MIAFIRAVDVAATGWAGAMFRACWQGGAAVALVWLICRCAPRLPARVRCWLWRLAYLKAMLALAWATPIELPLRPAIKSETPPSPVHLAAMNWTEDEQSAAPSFVAEPTPSRDAHPVRSSIRPTTTLFVAWFVGLMISTLRFGGAWRAARRLRAQVRPLGDSVADADCAEMSRRIGLHRPPRLAESNDVASPLLVGVVQPTIVFPTRLVERADSSAVRLMLAHELAHLRRRDLLWNWLPALAQGLFFFHPLIWLARREQHAAQEAACDAEALALTGAEPREYGGALLDAIAFASRSRRGGVSSMFVVGVVSSVSRKTLERRLIAMSNLRHWSSKRLVLTGVAVFTLGTIGLVPWRVVAQQQSGAADEQPSQAATVAKESSKEKEADAKTYKTVDDADSSMRVFALKHGRASQIAQQVLMLFKTSDEKSKRLVNAVPDVRTNSLIVVAPRESMELISGVIQQWDADVPGEAKAPTGASPTTGVNPMGNPAAAGTMKELGRVVSDTLTLRAPVDGVVSEVKANEGDRVKKSDLLIQFDDRKMKLGVVGAESQLQMEKAELEKLRRLRDQKVSDELSVQQAEAKLNTAAAELQLKQQQLNELRLHAPMAGVLSQMAAHEGEIVQRGDVLAKLVNTDAMKVEFFLPASMMNSIKMGQKVQIHLSDKQDSTLSGEICFIAPEIDSSSDSGRVKASVKDTDGRLRTGMTVEVTIEPTSKVSF